MYVTICDKDVTSRTGRLSLLHRPLTVLVGAMVTTGGVLGTLWPPGGTMTGPRGPRLGVLTGELWFVAGDETGEDSLLMEEPAERKEKRKKKKNKAKGLLTFSPADIYDHVPPLFLSAI